MKPATPTMQTTVGFFSPLATILCCACDCGDAGSAQWWDKSTARSGERELPREFDACYRVRARRPPTQGRDAVRSGQGVLKTDSQSLKKPHKSQQRKIAI